MSRVSVYVARLFTLTSASFFSFPHFPGGEEGEGRGGDGENAGKGGARSERSDDRCRRRIATQRRDDLHLRERYVPWS